MKAYGDVLVASHRHGSLRCGWTVPSAPRLRRLSTGFAGLGVLRSNISPSAANTNNHSRSEQRANKHTRIGLLAKRQQLGKIDYDKSVNQPGSKSIVHASILKSSVPNNFTAVVTYAIILASTLIVERD